MAKKTTKNNGDNINIFQAIELFEKENGISTEVMIENIKMGIFKAIKRDYPDCENINVILDAEKQIFKMSILKEIVEGEPETDNEINIDEAKTIDKNAMIGGVCEISLSTAQFGRVAAQSAKQSIRHDIKEFEKKNLIAQFEDKINECVSATVQKVEPDTLNAVLKVDNTDVYLVRAEQIPNEVLRPGQIIKVFVVGIANPDKKPSLKISRTHKDLVKRLFEREVPEIYDGTVEVKSISREAGSRSKIAVYSKDKNVDAVGACIGPKRSRIANIVEELRGEKIDIIPYNENDADFIASALAPAEVISVELFEEAPNTCKVVVPNSQLSLAIGNKGQNAKLAARLTGYKIDITPEIAVDVQ